MQILKFYADQVNERFIAQAVEALRDGHIIVYPIDTLYALGCDALNQRAIERLCKVKGLNPDKNLLSVVCSDIGQAAEYARIDNRAFRVLKEYLPGPFTFILPASTKLPKVFKGRKTVGVRIPDNNVARALAEALGNPLLTSSVAVAEGGAEDAAEPDALAMEYGASASLLLDGGTGSVEPSTIVDLMDSSAPEVLRQGKGDFND